MFLRKIGQSRFVQITRTYYVWIAYIFLIFLLTNAISSLDLIKSYRFTFDMLLTYGFLTFLINLESLASAAFIAVVHISLKKLLNFDISPIVRILLICGLGITVLNLLLMVFNKAIF
jgi:hypothetical protein